MSTLGALLVFLTIFVSSTTFLGNKFVENGSRRLFNYVVARAYQAGLGVQTADYYYGGFSSPTSLIWRNIILEGNVLESRGFARDETFSIFIDKAVLSLDNPIDQTCVLKITGLKADMVPENDTGGGSKQKVGKVSLKLEEFSIRFRLTSFAPDRIILEIKDMAGEAERLIKEGRTKLDVVVVGGIGFVYKNRYGEGKIYIQNEGGEKAIVMDKGDVRRLCRLMGEDVWDEEVDLMCRWPIRVPKVIQIRDYARSQAVLISDERKLIPEKAYRHILWSYLLAQKYGKNFAYQVTKAHEVRMDPEEKMFGVEEEDATAMDLNNDRVGVRYAERGYTEESLPGRVENDPEVIFYPGGRPGEHLSPTENNRDTEGLWQGAPDGTEDAVFQLP